MSSHAAAPNVAHFASATSASADNPHNRHRYDVNDIDDSDNGHSATVTPPSSSGQGIELVELPPPSTGTATAKSTQPTRRGVGDELLESSRAPIGRWSIDRRLQDSWEKGEQQDEDRFRLPHIAPQRVESWAEALRQRQRQRPGDKAGAELKMKFSHSLQFNAVSDWSAYYIAYSNLKKL